MMGHALTVGAFILKRIGAVPLTTDYFLSLLVTVGFNFL
jgi:hypothetical protein